MSFAARLTTKAAAERRRTCSHCARLGHQASTCTNQESQIDKVGIEIEGYWFDLAAAKRKAQDVIGRQGTSDGSLRSVSTCTGNDTDLASDGGSDDESHADDCEDDECSGCVPTRRNCDQGKRDCKVCGARAWEFQTAPGTLGEGLRQLTQMYPDVTSRSAALHVHLSFKQKDSLTLLASEDFFQYFRRKWKAWGERMNVREGSAFWERLEGQNQYCRQNTMTDWPTAQYGGSYMYINRHNDRYRQLNFHAWDEHTTVEVRLLPMFQQAKLAVSAVEELIAMFDDYLNNVVVNKSVDTIEAPKHGIIASKIEGEIELPAWMTEAYAPLRRTVEGEVELEGARIPSKAERDELYKKGIIVAHDYEIPGLMKAHADKMAAEQRKRNRS